jgi:hypothetical protein
MAVVPNTMNDPNSEFKKVKAYQKIMKTGKAVVVRNYQRKGVDMMQKMGKSVYLGRPAIAATPGTFAGDRSVPGLWHIADATTPQAP